MLPESIAGANTSMKNPLTINPSGADRLTLEFERASFSEFVFSLLATPRRESRTLEVGFDVTLGKIRTLIEKLAHKIKTDHDVHHDDFLAEVFFDDGSRISFASYDQLFSSHDYRDGQVEKIQFSISVLIPFNRLNGDKSLEKQTILVSFEAGSVGRVVSEISSTEISWPGGYFLLIEQHCRQMSAQVKRAPGGKWARFVPFHRFF